MMMPVMNGSRAHRPTARRAGHRGDPDPGRERRTSISPAAPTPSSTSPSGADVLARGEQLLARRAGGFDVTPLATGIPGLDLVLGGGFEPGLRRRPRRPARAPARRSWPSRSASRPPRRNTRPSTTRPCRSRTPSSSKHLEPFAFFDPEPSARRVEHIHLGDLLREPAGGLEPWSPRWSARRCEDQPAVVVIDSAKLLRDFAGETRAAGGALRPDQSHRAHRCGAVAAGRVDARGDGKRRRVLPRRRHHPARLRAPRARRPPLAAGGEAARRPAPRGQTHVPHQLERHRGLLSHRDPHRDGHDTTRWPDLQRHARPGRR